MTNAEQRTSKFGTYFNMQYSALKIHDFILYNETSGINYPQILSQYVNFTTSDRFFT